MAKSLRLQSYRKAKNFIIEQVHRDQVLASAGGIGSDSPALRLSRESRYRPVPAVGEYAILAAGIAMSLLVALTQLGGGVEESWNEVNTAVQSTTYNAN